MSKCCEIYTRNFTKSVRACVDQLLTIRLLTTNGADPRDNPTRKSRDCVAQKLSSKPGNLILSAFIQSMQPRKRFLVRSTIDKSPLHFPLFPFSPPLASSLSLSLSLSRGRDRFNNARKDAIARRVHTPSVCCHIDWLARYYVMSLTRRLHMRLARPAPLCPPLRANVPTASSFLSLPSRRVSLPPARVPPPPVKRAHTALPTSAIGSESERQRQRRSQMGRRVERERERKNKHACRHVSRSHKPSQNNACD